MLGQTSTETEQPTQGCNAWVKFQLNKLSSAMASNLRHFPHRELVAFPQLTVKESSVLFLIVLLSLFCGPQGASQYLLCSFLQCPI